MSNVLPQIILGLAYKNGFYLCLPHYLFIPRCIIYIFFHFQQKDGETIQTQQLLEKIDDYETQLEDYKSELDKVNKVRNTLFYL